jgi:hypothetical protein
MKRRFVLGLVTIAAAVVGSGQASAATLTVCPSGCAFTQIAPALAAAHNGDTIAIAAGRYDGGLTIDKSVKLAGAGSAQTIISGGGPVLTIGTFGASSEPTVSIDGVTITGGVTRSSPESIPFTGQEGVFAAGGGIEIPPNADFSGGATVTITNSVISDNRVAPSNTGSCGGTCVFAFAVGGGLDNWGTLTLAHTTVSNNRIGSATGVSALASHAEGAGIHSRLGALTISNSVVSGNQAAATGPNGVVADAGGIDFGGGTLTISNSSVTDNSATVTGDLSVGFVPSGGIHVQGDAQAATINNSTISGNAATVTNSLGSAFAGQGGLNGEIGATLSNDAISDNSVSATTLPGSTGDAVGRSGAGEIGGTLTNVRLTGNSVDVHSAAGKATALGGASVFDFGTITNSLISNNHIHAAAPSGSVDVRGGGINTFGPTTLRNSTVSGNTVDASGTSGSARGGGIFDGVNPDGPPGGPLLLQDSNVTNNVLTGTAGITLQGGGIYLQDEPITLTNSTITGNIPDECFGC